MIKDGQIVEEVAGVVFSLISVESDEKVSLETLSGRELF